MRLVLSHFLACKKTPGARSDCPLCSQLVGIVAAHSIQCDAGADGRCPVPLCDGMRAAAAGGAADKPPLPPPHGRRIQDWAQSASVPVQ